MIKKVDNLIAKKFVNNLLLRINTVVPFCLARGINNIRPCNSDVDIIINRKKYKYFHEYLISLQIELDFEITNIIKRQYVYSHILFLKKHHIFIQIDTEFDFDWWSFIIIESEDIIKRSRKIESLSYASQSDKSFMNFFRSLLWGGFLKKIHEKSFNFFDSSYVSELTNLKLPKLNATTSLNYFFQSKNVRKLKRTKFRLILNNVKIYGIIKTCIRFLMFLFFEIKLLNSKNGTVIYVYGDSDNFKLFMRNLNEYIFYYNAPFKSLAFCNNISIFKKRKLIRDSYLLISESKTNAEFEINIDDEVFCFKKNNKIIYSSDYYNINNLIFKMYNLKFNKLV